VDAYLTAVSNTCAEAGADERDYWLADPAEAVALRPACLADRPDQLEATLAAASREAEQNNPTLLTRSTSGHALTTVTRHGFGLEEDPQCH
jgi:hypothetical protein